jgi:hypothetical protein
MPARHHSHCDWARLPTLAGFGWTPSAISAEVGIPRATVYRIKDDSAKAVALLETWGIS